MRMDRDHKARAWHAWHTALMSKMSGRMPSLESLTERTRARRPAGRQSWEQQRDIGRMYTALLGGTVQQQQQVVE